MVYTVNKEKIAFMMIGMLFLCTSCVQQDYDLSKGLDKEITIGGDSLSILLGTTQKVELGSLITEKSIAMLKIAEDGTYSLHKEDSLKVSVAGIKPVTFTIAPLDLKPVDLQFSETKFPSFKLNNEGSTLPITIPDLNVKRNIVPIQYIKNIFSPIPNILPSFLKQNITRSNAPSSSQLTITPIIVNESGTVDQTIDLDVYPSQVKKVNRINLSNNVMTITLNHSQLGSLGFSTRNETIDKLSITFPPEYHISNPQGQGTRIQGNVFLVERASFSSFVDEISFKVTVDYVDLTKVLQNGGLNYVRSIPYSLKYTLNGDISNPTSLNGKFVNMSLAIDLAAAVQDLDMVTNDMKIDNTAGLFSINKSVDGIPTEVSSISTLNFGEGSYMMLTIDDPNLQPLAFSAGNCEIKLPKSMRFAPLQGLNTLTNTYTLPYNEIYGSHRLDLIGANINQIIPATKREIVFDDVFSYNMNGFVIGATSMNSNQVASLSNKNFNISLVSSNIDIKDASITTNQINTVVPTQTTSIKIDKFVSDDLKRLYSSTFTHPVTSHLKLEFSGLPPGIDSLFFKNYTIQFPSSMKFVAGTTNFKNQIIINRGFKVSDGFTKEFDLEGLDYGASGLDLVNGIISLNEEITISGSVYVKESNMNFADLGTVHVTPSFKMDDITLALVDAKLDPIIKPVSQIVHLGLPQYLMNDKVSLDVKKPVINLTVGNTMGMPVDVSVNLIPKRNGIPIPDATITTKFSIASAAKLGESTWSKFWLAGSAEGVSAGYQPIVIPNIANLLKKLPDEIEVSMIPTVTGDHHKVDLLAQKNQMDMKYSFHVPFDFGEDFNVVYLDTIADLQTKIEKYVDYTKTLTLLISVDNQIPFDMNLDLAPLDKNKNKIEGISISKGNNIKSGNVDGTSQNSKIELEIKETVVGSLSKLDAFEISVTAKRNSTIAGMPLRTNQSFSLGLRLKIPGGITYGSKK